MGIVGTMGKESGAQGQTVILCPASTQVPLSNINRLDNHLVMSTGADVILGVILAMTGEAGVSITQT